MTGQQDIQPIVNPALERAKRLERAFNHVARAIELDLADLALDDGEIDEASKQELRELGAIVLRVSQVGLTTVDSLASALGETPTLLNQSQTSGRILPTAEKTPQEETHASAQIPLPVPQPAPEDSSSIVPDGSRLNRQSEQIDTPKKRRETPEKVQYEGELYARIVSVKQTPEMELREGMEPLPLRIISDDTIVLNGDKILLDGDKLFAFNALMRLRDEITTSKNLRKLGFRLDGVGSSTVASQTFSRAMSELISDLEQATGINGVAIIKKIGKAAGTKYAVNPAVVLIDERFEDTSTESGEEIADVKKK